MPSVVLIGNFDGVHAGHRALLLRAREVASGDSVIVLSFDPHPGTVLGAHARPIPERVTTFERRRELLVEGGADRVEKLEPSVELLELTPEAFVERHVLPLEPRVVVEGPDFRFGHRRLGGIETLRALGEGHGFEVEVVGGEGGGVEVSLLDGGCALASSTIARWLLSNGRVRDAARVLGRAHEVTGVVTRGDRRGRGIGFPTANVECEQMHPGDGVYACVATLADGRRFAAAVNIGQRPTFAGLARTVEAFLIDAPRQGDAIEGLVEYGWGISLSFVSRVRDQVRFPSLEALVAQLRRDVAMVRERTQGLVEESGAEVRA